jgi:hypothetical protein
MHLAPEPFVDAIRDAEFLSLKPRRVLELARTAQLPAYPLGTGLRRIWRFRLSELVTAMQQHVVYLSEETGYRTLPAPRQAGSTK